MISSLIETYAIAVIAAILVIFAGVFLLLLLYTTFHRYIISRQRKRDEQTENRIQPLIFSYLDGQIDAHEFSAQVQKRHELMVAYQNINLMIDNITGDERRKLKALLELPRFKQHFYRKLRSSRPMHVAQACKFFSQKSSIDKKTIRRLTELQQYEYNVIAYASTLALVNSNDRQVRDKALIRFLHREQNASMAVNDIIFKYYEKNTDKEEAAEKLVFYVMDNTIPEKTTAAVLSMFPEFGLYAYTSDLYKMLVRIIPKDKTGILTATLIGVLHQFSDEKIVAKIEDGKLWESPFVNIRLQVTLVLANQQEARYKDILLKLAHDPELEVRIIAQQALLKLGQAEIRDQAFSTEILPEWMEMKRSRGEYVYTY